MLEAALPREPGAPPGRARCGPWAWCGSRRCACGAARPAFKLLSRWDRRAAGLGLPGGSQGPGRARLPLRACTTRVSGICRCWLPTRKGEPRGDRAATPKTCLAGTAANRRQPRPPCAARWTPSGPSCRARRGAGRSWPHVGLSRRRPWGTQPVPPAGSMAGAGAPGAWGDPSLPLWSRAGAEPPAWAADAQRPGRASGTDGGCGSAAAAAHPAPAPATCSPPAFAPRLKGPPGCLRLRACARPGVPPRHRSSFCPVAALSHSPRHPCRLQQPQGCSPDCPATPVGQVAGGVRATGMLWLHALFSGARQGWWL